MAKTQTARARALSDNESLGFKCEQLVEGPEKVIQALTDAGAVDNHPDAVEYATKQSAKVVALADPDAAAELAASVIENKQAEADGAAQDPAA
ncbi:hypothetical protein [Burkholderia vietnamiensis]|uniref:hypothetical protein n=1 Tax=Burkholderia vietnamiensis TaxID=60552 RepID=UPI00158FAC47|nr:hypothetical protein [Burkholderia vietnamiensis]MCA7943259.1 hypothetical protein [Burkholderia vietnamiensis]